MLIFRSIELDYVTAMNADGKYNTVGRYLLQRETNIVIIVLIDINLVTCCNFAPIDFLFKCIMHKLQFLNRFNTSLAEHHIFMPLRLVA